MRFLVGPARVPTKTVKQKTMVQLKLSGLSGMLKFVEQSLIHDGPVGM